MATITMKEMLESGIHFGHQTQRWNPKMARYIFGERHGVYIINLQKTLRQMQRAYKLARDVAADGGTVLFVGTKKQAREAVQEQAERCGMYYVNNRWLGGTLTNWVTIQRSIDKLHGLEDLFESGKAEQFSKKEQIEFQREADKLNRNLYGIKKLDRLPNLVFVVDTVREKIAVREARRLGIPCIGICDTNSDPDVVDIAIPGNDDAIRAINLFCSVIADAVLEGHSQFEKEQESAASEGGSGPKVTIKSSKLAKGQEKAGDEEEPSSEASAGDESATEDAPASDDSSDDSSDTRAAEAAADTEA